MKLMFWARVRRRASSKGDWKNGNIKCGQFSKSFKTSQKTNRTYSLKKADFDGVSKSAFGLSKGDYLGIFN